MPYLVGKHPYVKLKVKLPKGNKWLGIDCLIDTGFSGGIVLPLTLKDYFVTKEFIEARFLLADNSEITVDITYTLVEYKEKKKETAVVFMGDFQGLVGVEFLNQMRFCLDLKKNKAELNF